MVLSRGRPRKNHERSRVRKKLRKDLKGKKCLHQKKKNKMAEKRERRQRPL